MKETSFDQTVYPIDAFLSVDVKTWGERLKEHHLQCMHQPASGSQRKAWFDCFNILRSCFQNLPDPSCVRSPDLARPIIMKLLRIALKCTDFNLLSSGRKVLHENKNHLQRR